MTHPIDDKNRIRIEAKRVVKHFLHGHNSLRRFRREREALRRMAGLDGVPALLEDDADERRLVITRIPGVALPQCDVIPDHCFITLRNLVDAMLQRGVARHSLPPRDVILRPDGSAGLVDFERGTLRGWRWSPVWWMACKVTRFHLVRLIDDHAPHLLTAQERHQLNKQRRIRTGFRRFLEWRRRLAPK